ncbi:uncharacterized protein PSFLO_07069 [Pseudozyma flocculosa]|uniref:Uncharacterized protein n=1 Tax=Pseudozyma flocculosa TaxID=84751 RepID=A0A5C3FD78_9BASI|nr:uncharacterized protein PSFLO_07069 [Pseudozyma flocculosa]
MAKLQVGWHHAVQGRPPQAEPQVVVQAGQGLWQDAAHRRRPAAPQLGPGQAAAQAHKQELDRGPQPAGEEPHQDGPAAAQLSIGQAGRPPAGPQPVPRPQEVSMVKMSVLSLGWQQQYQQRLEEHVIKVNLGPRPELHEPQDRLVHPASAGPGYGQAALRQARAPAQAPQRAPGRGHSRRDQLHASLSTLPEACEGIDKWQPQLEAVRHTAAPEAFPLEPAWVLPCLMERFSEAASSLDINQGRETSTWQ